MPGRVLVTVALAVAALCAGTAPSQAFTIKADKEPVGEGGGQVTYTVTQDLGDPATANVTVAGSGSAPATPGQDMGAPNPATLDFGGIGTVMGTQRPFTVPILDDGADEPDETFTVTVGNSQPVTTTITDDDMTIDVAGSTVAEGGLATVTFTPRGPSPHDTTVTYGTIPATADQADFTAVAPTPLTWAANDTAPKTVSIATTQDATDENDEQLGVLFSSAGANGASLSAAGVAITITDDDPPPLAGAVPAHIAEGDSGTRTASVLVALSAPSGKTVRVPYRTRDGTAGAPSDYGTATGTLTFNPGETTKAITVAIKGDRTPEPDEAFGIVLGAPENATLAPGRDTATVTIDDDDGGASDDTPPRLRIGAPRAKGSRVTLSVTCPASERTCRGTLTLFTVPNRRSKISGLRVERRLARATYRLNGRATRRVTLKLSGANRRLLRRGRSVRVRAFAVTTDANGNVANASRSATLRFS